MQSEEFQGYYEKIFGARWPTLRQAMQEKAQKSEQFFFKEIAQPYVMDLASVWAAEFLQVKPHQKVLDMCAAPGGKSLCLAKALQGTGELWCNELSSDRRYKLKRILEDYIPEQMRQNIKVLGKDAVGLGMIYPEKFDRILVDAPCSSERHRLQSEEHMSFWSLKNSKYLAQKQYSLLCSGLLALKPQGFMVYSTCSLSPLENDGVVERFLQKKGTQVTIDFPAEFPIKDAIVEKTTFGWQILPDRGGLGPLFIARFKKNGGT
ncbi:MAG: RsmB/NOP family class I SAM-dependent RNA methyltransferase [Bacteriovoracaceae bacterium]|nr:RsmB/NOP family class I SAM-dependent RNA methyltransferase [Bacteriovoracaceae bacterium]